jgi:hypothetical protein
MLADWSQFFVSLLPRKSTTVKGMQALSMVVVVVLMAAEEPMERHSRLRSIGNGGGVDLVNGGDSNITCR